MELPKFLMADNFDFPLDLFVVHTEYPRFILNVEKKKVKCFDYLEGEEEEALNELDSLIKQAFDFCESEIRKYQDDEEE